MVWLVAPEPYKTKVADVYDPDSWGTTLYIPYSGDPQYNITIRLVTGTKNRADGFMEYYYNGKLAYRVDDDWWGPRVYTYGGQSDLDSLKIKDIGITISEIAISYFWTCDPPYVSSNGNASLVYDDLILFEFTENYDSAYYNEEAPIGHEIPDHPGWDIDGGYKK